MTESSTLQTRTNRFLRASELGLFGQIILALTVSWMDPAVLPYWFRLSVVFCWIVFMAALIVMFAYRNTDEYTQDLWNTGTSTSFMITIALIVFGTVIEAGYRFFTVGGEHDFSYVLTSLQTVTPLVFLVSVQARRIMKQ